MKTLNKHILIIIKLLVLLLFTVNSAEFEFRSFIDKILNESYLMRLISLYILCLTYIITVEEKIDRWDFIDAAISTGFFLLFIKPEDITKTNKDSNVLSIPIAKLSGYE